MTKSLLASDKRISPPYPKLFMKRIAITLPLLFLFGCSSFIEGTSEVVIPENQEFILEFTDSLPQVSSTSEFFTSTSELPTPTPQPSSTPLLANVSTPAPSPTPNQNIYQTPTQLPEPHIIEIIDWEMVTANAAPICGGCSPSITTIKAPPGLSIALIQISATGDVGSSSVISSTLAYGNKVNCVILENSNVCASIFGQVSFGEIILSAHHESGGQQQIEYRITFQEWAEYQP